MDKKILVFVFIIFHISAVIIWNWDNEYNVPDKIIDIYGPYMYSLSLWQAWDIFSPDVSKREASTKILVDVDNRTDTYIPYYSEEGIQFLFTRFRKFNDNIIANKDPDLNLAYLSYLCKKFYKIYEPEFQISFQVVHEDIVLPNQKNGGITCS